MSNQEATVPDGFESGWAVVEFFRRPPVYGHVSVFRIGTHEMVQTDAEFRSFMSWQAVMSITPVTLAENETRRRDGVIYKMQVVEVSGRQELELSADRWSDWYDEDRLTRLVASSERGDGADLSWAPRALAFLQKHRSPTPFRCEVE